MLYGLGVFRINAGVRRKLLDVEGFANYGIGSAVKGFGLDA